MGKKILDIEKGKAMLKVHVEQGTLWFGEAQTFGMNFQRTLRIPDDNKTYPLPPGLGTFPICKVDDFKDRVPSDWVEHGGVFIPMYQREAMWVNFVMREYWKPRAVKIAIGKVNAVSGKPWTEMLSKDKEDYLVCPPQPWLDGINAGDGYIKQFVAMPLGMGYTVEAQVTGQEKFGGIQVIVYEPKPGKFQPPPPMERRHQSGGIAMPMMVYGAAAPAAAGGAEMGLGAGGKMKQKIYPDPHGIDTWDSENSGRVYVHIVNSLMYREITGHEPPETPITAKTYQQHGYPWFDLYDDHLRDIQAPDALKQVKSIKEMDAEKGFKPQQDDSSVDVPEDKIVKYNLPKDPNEIRDGEW
jgi:hypothetical protein